MQAFQEYGLPKLEYKKGCLRTDDIEGAQPKSFKKHIWGKMQTDRESSNELSKSRASSRLRSNPINIAYQEENSNINIQDQKEQQQQNDILNNKSIRMNNMTSSQLYNLEQPQKYIPPSRNPLLLNQQALEGKPNLPFLEQNMSQKALNVRHQFQLEAQKKQEQKQQMQNQFEIGLLDKIDQFNREPVHRNFQYNLKQKHHFPQNQYYREKVDMKNHSEIFQPQNQNIITNNSSAILQVQQQRKNYKSSDNLNQERQKIRENFQDAMINNKLYLFNDPVPFQNGKRRILQHDMSPYKYNYQVQKNQSSVKI